MDAAVKMPGAQLNVNAANRAQTAQKSSDTGIEFIKLLQVKGEQTKPSTQEKTQQKPKDAANSPSKDVNDTTGTDTNKKPENLSQKPETEEIDAEEMAQQAAVQQAAALLAGMVTEAQETTPEEIIPETENLPSVGEVLAETVSPTPELPDAGSAELNPVQPLTEAPTEVFNQASVQETTEQPEQAVPVESLQQKAAQATENTSKADNKAEVTKQEDNTSQTVQNVANEQKTEENPEAAKQSGQQNTAEKDSQKAEGILTSDTEASQAQAAGAESSFHVFGTQNQNSLFAQKTETVSMRTTPETLPEDLGKTLGAKFADGARTLTVELEPASLGKLTIRLTYEGDRAAVSIMATNPKTLEMLNQKASEIAAILEEKTGQQTIIFTQKPETNEDNYDRNPDGKREREDQEEKKQQNDDHHQMESFAQQLRLGLV